MLKFRCLLVVGLGLSLVGPAQAANPYDGTWSMSFETTHEDLDGILVVKDDGGTWRVDAKSAKSPCVGRESPIVVKKATGAELVFEVQRSKGLASCKDWTVAVKRVDAKTLKGEFADHRPITLLRQ